MIPEFPVNCQARLGNPNAKHWGLPRSCQNIHTMSWRVGEIRSVGCAKEPLPLLIES